MKKCDHCGEKATMILFRAREQPPPWYFCDPCCRIARKIKVGHPLLRVWADRPEVIRI